MMNKRKVIFGLIVLFILVASVVSLVLARPEFVGNLVKIDFVNSTENVFGFTNSYTTAICNGNACRDYEIVCLDSDVVRIDPVSGTVVFPDNWKDLREENKFCE